MIGDQLAGEREKYGNMDDTADKNVERYFKSPLINFVFHCEYTFPFRSFTDLS